MFALYVTDKARVDMLLMGKKSWELYAPKDRFWMAKEAAWKLWRMANSILLTSIAFRHSIGFSVTKGCGEDCLEKRGSEWHPF